MDQALQFGLLFGALAGSVHALHLYRQIRREPHAVSDDVQRKRAAYFALWTLALWLLFGSYVLYLWLIAVIVRAAAALRQPRRD